MTIKFQFISGGETSDYRVIDWGKPWHGSRLMMRWHATPLYLPDGTKQLNYTDDEYQKFVVGLVGFARLSGDSGDRTPWEVIKAFNAHLTEEYERFCKERPGLVAEAGPLQLVKGRYYYESPNYTLVKELIPS